MSLCSQFAALEILLPQIAENEHLVEHVRNSRLVQASDQPVEGQAYNSTLSQLHMTLAKKNAEVEHLRSSLSSMQAETAANAQQASGMFSSDTLDKAQR